MTFFTGRMPLLSPNQQCQSTEGKDTQKLLDNYTHREAVLSRSIWHICT